MPMVEWYFLLPPAVAVVVVVGIVWFFRLYFMAFDMMDWLHWISFGVGIGQVVFILYYYIPLMQWHVSGEHTTGTEHKDKFISDLLCDDLFRGSSVGCVCCICHASADQVIGRVCHVWRGNASFCVRVGGMDCVVCKVYQSGWHGRDVSGACVGSGCVRCLQSGLCDIALV